MRKIALAAIAAVAFSAPALAAPPAGVFNWSGFYLGASAGYGWNDTDKNPFITTNLGGLASYPTLNAAGPFLGAQGGFNWQMGQFLLGIEIDFQGAGINGDNPGTLVGPNFFVTDKAVHWFGTARGRVGYAMGPLLIYGTGGFAYGEVNNRVFVNGVADARAVEMETGYAAGGGVEWALDQVWSAKVEYEYINLGRSHLSAAVVPPNGVIVFATPVNNFSTVRIGLNYKFGTR